MKKVVAVVPVKQNSSRLANKNILPFAGSTLLEYKINQLKQVESLSEIIVSSDSDDMLKMALRQGVSVDRRPLCYANESRPFGEFVEYLADMIIEKCGVESHLLWACCTSPLVSVKRYKEAISLYFKYLGEFDSLISVYKWRHYMFDKAGPMNFKRGAGHVNSQELPAFDLFTCGILLCPIVKAKEWKYNFGLKPYRFELNQVESVDIDTEFDYYCALAGLEMMRDKGIVESQNANPQTVNRSSHSVTGGGKTHLALIFAQSLNKKRSHYQQGNSFAFYLTIAQIFLRYRFSLPNSVLRFRLAISLYILNNPYKKRFGHYQQGNSFALFKRLSKLPCDIALILWKIFTLCVESFYYYIESVFAIPHFNPYIVILGVSEKSNKNFYNLAHLRFHNFRYLQSALRPPQLRSVA